MIPFKIFDRQTGRYFASGKVFTNQESAREHLLSYHSIDSDPEDITILDFDQIIEYGDWEIEELVEEFYPVGGLAFSDGKNYYNALGQLLRNPNDYDRRKEGYTPFGDEGDQND